MAQGRGRFETRTGFSVHGAGVASVSNLRWASDPPFLDAGDTGPGKAPPLHLRLHPKDPFSTRPSSILIEFDTGTGTVLPVLPSPLGRPASCHNGSSRRLKLPPCSS